MISEEDVVPIKICLFLIFSLPVFCGTPLKVVRIFPTDEQMQVHDFAVTSAKQIRYFQGRLYLLDQGEHGVHVFDVKGNWLSLFGGQGEGPGEMSWPHWMTANDETLFIVDQSSHIHEFDFEGNFRKKSPVIDFFFRFEYLDNGFFMATLNPKSDFAYATFDRDFRKIDSYTDTLPAITGKPRQDKRINIFHDGKAVYGLQKYGDAFRIFSSRGEIVKKGRMTATPLSDPNHDDLWIFPSFVMHQGHFIANIIDKGHLSFMVFTNEGQLVERIHLPVLIPETEPDEKFYVIDMDTFAHEGTSYLAVALLGPISTIVLLRIDDAWLTKEAG
jgi:hypothetical protein